MLFCYVIYKKFTKNKLNYKFNYDTIDLSFHILFNNIRHMNIELSKKLLYDLNNKRETQTPLIDAIPRLYILSWDQKTLLQKKSIRGRIRDLMTRRGPQQELRNRTIKVVIQAFSTLKQSNQVNDLPVPFYQELDRLEKKLAPKPALPRNAELEILKANQEELLKEERREQAAKFADLLAARARVLPESSQESFEKFFINDPNSNEAEAIHSLYDFAKKYPDEMIPDFETEAKFLENSLETSQVFEQTLLSDLENNQTLDKREAQYSKEAAKMADQITKLGDRERWLYCGESSDTNHSLAGSLHLFHSALNSFHNGIPPEIKNILEKLKNRNDLEITVRKLLDQNLSSFFDQTRQISSVEALKTSFIGFIQPVMKSVEEFFGRAYPETFINNSAKTVYTVAQEEIELLVNDKDALLKFLQLLKIDQKSPERKDKEAEVKNEIVKMILPRIKKILHRIEDNFSKFAEQVDKSIPSSIQAIFDLRFSRALFWMEVVREDKNATIHIYATGYLNDDSAASSGKAEWPKTFKDIPLKQLSEEFFHRLLFLLIEPGFSGLKVDKKALYEGLLPYLGGVEASQTVLKSTIEQINAPLGMIQQRLLIHPEKMQEILWEQYEAAFIHKLKTFYKKDTQTLEISAADGLILLNAIDQLMKKRGEFKNAPGISAGEINMIRAFIASSMPNPGQGENGTAGYRVLMDLVVQIFSVDQLRQSKSALTWAFGDEAAEFIDFLVEEIENYPVKEAGKPPATLPVSSKKKRSLLDRKEFFKLKIAYTIISGTMTLVQWAYFLSKLYQLNTTLIYSLLMKAFFYFGLSKYIPKTLKNYYYSCLDVYQECMTEVKMKALEWLVNHFVAFFLDKETQKEVYSKIDLVRGSGAFLFKHLLGKQPVDLEISNYSFRENCPEIDISSTEITVPRPEKVFLNKSILFDHLYEDKVLHNSNHIVTHIDEIVELCKSMKLENASLESLGNYFELISNKLFILPFPLKSDKKRDHKTSDEWDKFAWPEASAIVEKLLFVSFNYAAVFERLSDIKKYDPSEFRCTSGDYVNEYYFLPKLLAGLGYNLAIVDKLARKCPRILWAQIKIYTPFLFETYSSIDDPQLSEHFAKLHDYFESDLQMPKTEDEKIMLGRKTLFYPIYDGRNILSVFSSDRAVECRFLKSCLPLLEKPENQKILLREEIEFRRDTFYFTKKEGSPTEAYLLSILFRESFKVKDSCLPLSYCSLNLLSRLCQKFARNDIIPQSENAISFDQLSENNQEKISDPNKDLETGLFPFTLVDYIFVPKSKMEKYLQSALLRESHYSRLHYSSHWVEDLFGSNVYKPGYLNFPIREQPGIYERPNNLLFFREETTNQNEMYIDDQYHKQQSKQFELIHVNEIDMPLRVMGYLKAYFAKETAFETISTIAFNQHSEDFLNHFRYCRRLLFMGPSLTRLLQSHPQVAQQFGTILSELVSQTPVHKDAFYHLADLTLSLEQFCKVHAPSYCFTFPDFRSILKNNVEDANSNRLCSTILNVLCIGEPEIIDDSLRAEYAMEIAKAYFQFPDGLNIRQEQGAHSVFLFGEISLERKWSHQLRLLYWKWLPWISEAAANPRLRERFFSELIGSISSEDGSSKWTLEYGDCYSNGIYKIDFNLAKYYRVIKDEDLPTQIHVKKKVSDNQTSFFLKEWYQGPYGNVMKAAKNLVRAEVLLVREILEEYGDGEITDKLKVLLRDIIGESRAIYPRSDGHYEDSSREFRIEFSLNYKIKVTRQYKDKTYRFLRTTSSKASYWLEETTQLKKTLLIFEEMKLKASYLIDEKASKVLAVIKNDLEYIPVDDFKITATFSKFCPANQIVCWGFADSNQLQRIDLIPYNLSFQIVLKNRQPRATLPELLPGYYIANDQAHSALKYHSTYLLLEDDHKQKKVILSNEQWKQSLATFLLPQIGSLKTMLSPFLLMLLSQGEKAEGTLPFSHFFSETQATSQLKYMIVSLEENGELTSESPEVLSKLIIFAVLQGNMEGVECASLQLENLLKRQYIPTDSLNLLVQILAVIPTSYLNISLIRRRLFSAIEENRSLYPENNSNAFGIAIFTTLAVYIDLKNNDQSDPRYRLSLEDEWSLYQRLSQSIYKVILSESSISSVSGIFNTQYVWELFFTQFVLHDSLKERYEFLKHTLHKNNSLPEQLFNLIVSTATDEGKVVKIPLELPAAIFNPLKNLIPNINSRNEWINLFKILIGYIQSTKQPISDKIEFKHTPTAPAEIKIRWNSASEFYEDFISAYLIAQGKGTEEQKSQLKQLLKLNRGGWDNDSKRLIEYLFTILSPHHYPFPAVPHLSAIPIWMAEINRRHHIVKMGSIITRISFKYGVNTAISATAQMTLPMLFSGLKYFPLANSILKNSGNIISHLPRGISTVNTLYFVSSVGRKYIENKPKIAASEKKQNRFLQPDLQKALKNEDRSFDSILTQLYNQTFEQIEYDQEKIAAFPEAQSTLNQSVVDYYRREGSKKIAVQLRGEEQLRQLYQNIADRSDELHTSLDQEISSLLTILNTRAKGLARPLNLKDLLKFLLEGSFKGLLPNLSIKPDDLLLIETTMQLYVIRKTRLQQYQRILGGFEMLNRYPSKSEEYARQMEQIIAELKSRRSYADLNFPYRILKHTLLLELFTNKMIWPRQANRIKERFKTVNQVLEFIMGMGKTELLSLLENFVDANGTKIIFNIWPSSLIDTNIRFLSKQNQPVNHLEINRNPAKRSYVIVQNILERIQRKGETVSQTKEEMQSLELMFIDYLYQAFTKNKNQAFQLAKDIGSVLLMIRQKGKAVGDEVHQLFDEKEELLRASGKATPMNVDDFNAIADCFKLLSKDDFVMNVIRANQLNDLTPKKRNEIILNLAESISSIYFPEQNSDSMKKELLDFLTNQSPNIPQWIQTSKQFRRLSMMKGVITVHLPLLLEKTVDVDFGPSIKKTLEEFARPYEANACPRERSTIRNPHEAACKTMLMFLYHGLSPRQIKRLVDQLLYESSGEAKKMKLSVDDTPSGRLFFEMTGKTIPLSICSKKSQEIESILKNSSKAIFWYLENQVHPQMRFWEINFRSNSHNFDAMFKSRDYKTGTPFNEGNYPDNTTMAREAGTIGEGLHILESKCSDTPVHHLENARPQNVLQEVLVKFFGDKKSRFTALIDGGAKLTGMDSFTVVKQMREFAATHRHDITVIDFFLRDDSGVDRLMSWPVGAADTIPYDQCHVPLDQRWAYYDQYHGFGANLKQMHNGKSLILVGLRHHLYRLLQEAFRMRGLKEFRFFLNKSSSDIVNELLGLNKETTQLVEFALTPPVTDALVQFTKKSVPEINLRDIFAFCEENQKNDLKTSHFVSYKQKVSNMVRSKVLDKLLKAIVYHSKQTTFSIFESVQEILISKVETNPVKLYMPQKLIPIDKVIEGVKGASLKLAENTGVFNSEEKMQLKQSIDSIPNISRFPMPDSIPFPIEGGIVNFDKCEDLDLSVEVEQENEVEQEQEQEQEQLLQEPVIENKDSSSWNVHFESSWADINPFSLSWLTFSEPGKSYVLEALKGAIVKSFNRDCLEKLESKECLTPPLYRVLDLLKESEFSSISKAFSNVIWLTDNFLPTQPLLPCRVVPIGSDKQRELFKIVVHMNKKTGDILSIGCLSQSDMSWWEQQFKKSCNNATDEMAAFLYDVPCRAVVGGDPYDVTILHKNPLFLEIEVQLKILNGDVCFSGSQIPHLENWLSKYDPHEMLEAFMTIHKQRGKDDFVGSIVDNILKSMIKEKEKRSL